MTMLVTDTRITPGIVAAYLGMLASHLDPSIRPPGFRVAHWGSEDAWASEPELTFLGADGALWTVGVTATERALPLRLGGAEITRWKGGHEVDRFVSTD